MSSLINLLNKFSGLEVGDDPLSGPVELPAGAEDQEDLLAEDQGVRGLVNKKQCGTKLSVQFFTNCVFIVSVYPG